MESTEKQSDRMLTRSEVAEKLQSIAVLNGIELTENHVEFHSVQTSANVEGTELSDAYDTLTLIRFEDITSISSFEARV